MYRLFKNNRLEAKLERRQILGPCRYCTNYINATARTYLNEKDKTKARLCKPKNRFVYSTGSCELFEFNNLIYCDRFQRWMALKVCNVKRYLPWGEEDCKNCKQGREITELQKGLKFAKTHVKPTLIKRNKPTLIKRRK